jgi:putative hydrolase of the HAD superfamily
VLEAVVFDWGGTLSKWVPVDLAAVWRLAARHIDHAREQEVVERLVEVEKDCWAELERTHRSARLADVLQAATRALRIDVTEALLEEAATHHLDSWTEYIEHDDDAAGVLQELRERGLKIGLLSNTMWPRAWHERFLERDGLLTLIDARVYTSDLAYSKPHPQAFAAALAAVSVDEPAHAMFVGDRPYDDISGAKRVGMMAVLRRNPELSNEIAGARANGVSVEPDAVIDHLRELVAVIDGLTGRC